MAIAGARIDENAGAGRCGEFLREAAPAGDASEPLVQQHEGRRRIWARADHAVFEPHLAELDKSLVGESHCAPLPVQLATTPVSFAKLCSTVSPEVSSSACARA